MNPKTIQSYQIRVENLEKKLMLHTQCREKVNKELKAQQGKLKTLEEMITTGNNIPQDWKPYKDNYWVSEILFPFPRSKVPKVFASMTGGTVDFYPIGVASIYDISVRGFKVKVKDGRNNQKPTDWKLDWVAIDS